ncbi:DUF2786 domain-containing protein (plasmid) [Paenibacillus peoriae]|uniref:DUF2786 domain-containing protein n=1 Tax=Paenibacillus peoriae TaxID=59893 RepID=A0A7H0YHD0_9BACL|nr:DUF2786 domain-containing protein [Paenibacillus peoriae]QNR70488.1 DUF2786 domain-containing protein [Paenibacillus peoriae]
MMKETDIIRKIQKAMKLSDGGGTAAESQNALLMAQRMAIKHGIDISELGELVEEQKREIVHQVVRAASLRSWWRERLYAIIADNFKVESYRTSEGKRNGKEFYRLTFTGFKEDVAIALEVYNHAEQSIQHHGRTYIRKMGKRIKSSNKNKYKNEYMKGYLDGLHRKFAEQVQFHGFQLALIKHPEVLAQTSHMERYEFFEPESISTGENAYEKGFKEGKDYSYPVGSLE